MSYVIEWSKKMVNGNLIFLRNWFCSVVWFSREWAVTGSGAGCYYKNSHQIPVYSSSRPSTVSITVRHYQDSLIAADEFTYGCSYTSSSSSSCFGQSRKEQNITGFVVAGIGVVLLIIEIIVIASVCFCCKEGAKTLSTKRQNDTNAPLINKWVRAIPIAQPVYPPQQQQQQQQQQPSYYPQQQQQPSYYPQQQQQQQPSYFPQQTGYIPQYGYVSRQ